MAIIYQPRRWTFKPPVSASINWGHSLAYGLIGCWLFNEGAYGPIDLISNRRGVPNGTIPWKVINALGVQSDGSSGYIDLGSTLPASSGTYSLVIRVTPSLFVGDYPMLVCRDAGTGNAWETGLLGGSFNPYYGFPGNAVLPFNGVIANNRMSDIVFTADGSTIFGYINGVKDTATATSSSWRNGNGALNFARRPGDGYFGSNIYTFHHVYIYRRCLTPSEVSTLYASPYVFLQPQSTRRYFFAAAPVPPASFMYPQYEVRTLQQDTMIYC